MWVLVIIAVQRPCYGKSSVQFLSARDLEIDTRGDHSVGLNGHFSFHWDEALGRMNSSNNARYLVISWNEIP